jgi:hypothetical protein
LAALGARVHASLAERSVCPWLTPLPN